MAFGLRRPPHGALRFGTSWSLRSRLVALAVLGALPALGLALADAEIARREALASARDGAAVALTRLADAQGREVRAGRVLLEALARNPAVTQGSAAACQAALAPLLAALPQFDDVVRRGPDGRVGCSARPRGKPAAAAAGDRPAGPPTLPITRRLESAPGTAAASLVAEMRQDWLQGIAKELVLPQGSHVLAFAGSGERILGSATAPTTLPGPVAAALRARRPGVPVIMDAFGALWAAQVVRDAGDRPLRLAVAIPTETAYATTRSLFARQLALVLIGALAVAGIAALGAERLLSRPIGEIADAARRISDGDLSARAPGAQPVPELGAFALAFNQMAEAVEERNRQLAALAERAPDGILRLAPDGLMLYANPAMTTLVGALPGTLAGQAMTSGLPAPLASALAELSAVATTGHDAAEREVELGTGDGRRVLEVRVVPEQSEDGAPPVSLAVVRDVSAARRTADALRQAQKLDSVGRLAGGIAHDFNNLLTGIVGHADLALETLPADHPAREDLDALRAAALRSTGMTRQLLMFARQQAPTLRALDVGELVRRVHTLLGRVLGDGVRLRLELTPGLPAVSADAAQLEQVLMNLAVNARDAMPHGGTLTIRTRLEDLDAGDAARIGLRLPGAYLALEVEDSGTGMSPDVLGRIFEPFFSTKAPGQGTGLGLATCYGIAKEHGGALVAASTLGIGSRMALYLPGSAAAVQAMADASDAWRTAPVGGREALLVAEDDAGLRELLARMLRARGYVVYEAADGATALALATGPQAPPLALVITDVRMPRLSGDAFVRQLRRARPGLPVLFMTGNPEVMDASGQLDGAPMLPKPFTSVQLLHAIRGILDRAPVA